MAMNEERRQELTRMQAELEVIYEVGSWKAVHAATRSISFVYELVLALPWAASVPPAVAARLRLVREREADPAHQ